MLNPESMWEELVLQARLKFLAFKRTIWMTETLFLFIVIALVMTLNVPNPWFWFAIFAQFGRVIAEWGNHIHLSRMFNVPDTFHWFNF